MSSSCNLDMQLLVSDGGGSQMAEGANIDRLRVSRARGLAVANSQSRFYDAVMRGRCFVGGTAATGVAPGTSIGTTAAFSLYNPAASGVNLVVLKVTMGWVSGTIGAGVIHYVANTNAAAAATTGTAITAVNCKIGAGSAPQGKPLTTATLPATPTVMRPFIGLNKIVLDTTAINADLVVDNVDGEFVIPPGMTLSLEGTTAAGSTPLVVYGIVWEEVPV